MDGLPSMLHMLYNESASSNQIPSSPLIDQEKEENKSVDNCHKLNILMQKRNNSRDEDGQTGPFLPNLDDVVAEQGNKSQGKSSTNNKLISTNTSQTTSNVSNPETTGPPNHFPKDAADPNIDIFQRLRLMKYKIKDHFFEDKELQRIRCKYCHQQGFNCSWSNLTSSSDMKSHLKKHHMDEIMAFYNEAMIMPRKSSPVMTLQNNNNNNGRRSGNLQSRYSTSPVAAEKASSGTSRVQLASPNVDVQVNPLLQTIANAFSPKIKQENHEPESSACSLKIDEEEPKIPDPPIDPLPTSTSSTDLHTHHAQIYIKSLISELDNNRTKINTLETAKNTFKANSDYLRKMWEEERDKRKAVENENDMLKKAMIELQNNKNCNGQNCQFKDKLAMFLRFKAKMDLVRDSLSGEIESLEREVLSGVIGLDQNQQQRLQHSQHPQHQQQQQHHHQTQQHHIQQAQPSHSLKLQQVAQANLINHLKRQTNTDHNIPEKFKKALTVSPTLEDVISSGNELVIKESPNVRSGGFSEKEANEATLPLSEVSSTSIDQQQGQITNGKPSLSLKLSKNGSDSGFQVVKCEKPEPNQQRLQQKEPQSSDPNFNEETDKKLVGLLQSLCDSVDKKKPSPPQVDKINPLLPDKILRANSPSQCDNQNQMVPGGPKIISKGMKRKSFVVSDLKDKENNGTGEEIKRTRSGRIIKKV